MPEAQGQFLVEVPDLKAFMFLTQAVLTRLRCRITGAMIGSYSQITATATEVYPGDAFELLSMWSCPRKVDTSLV
jgi:hypothetical protein